MVVTPPSSFFVLYSGIDAFHSVMRWPSALFARRYVQMLSDAQYSKLEMNRIVEWKYLLSWIHFVALAYTFARD